MNQIEARTKILEAVFDLFQNNGMKFTMDDVAAAVGMSKKTLYQLFRDKEDLLCQMVDFCFLSIKECESEVYKDPNMSTKDKIRNILGTMPDQYRSVDIRQLYILGDRYPKAYERLKYHLETGWEATIDLLEQGMEEGLIRPFSIPIFKMMFETSLERFFQRNILGDLNLSYNDGLNEVIDILLDGINLPVHESKDS